MYPSAMSFTIEKNNIFLVFIYRGGLRIHKMSPLVVVAGLATVTAVAITKNSTE